MKNNIQSFLTMIIALSLFTFSCSFVTSFTEKEKDVTDVSLSQNSIELAIGAMDLLSLSIKSSSGQQNVSVTWEYDSSIVSALSDNYGIVLTGLQQGNTIVRAKSGDYSATCVVRVLSEKNIQKLENPYVYVLKDYVSVSPGLTEKISASLYGGTQEDINGYTFTIDQPSVASLYVEGNYCWITGNSEGIARVTARHNKAVYGYSFLVNCTASATTIPYITTKTNIVTINKSTTTSAEFEVSMENPPYPTYADNLVYSVTDENGNPMSNSPIQISYTGKKCSITALESGSCFIKVSHKDCTYSLNVLVRVVENISTAYIEPSCGSILEINGNTSETITFDIINALESTSVNLNDFTIQFSPGAENYIDYQLIGNTENNKGNSVWITGKKSGSIKATITHPLCSQSRTIVLLVRNIPAEAASSKIYITTSQNYIKTAVGAESSTVNITLNNLSSGAEKDLLWSIENEAADGSLDPVVMYQSGTGTSKSSSFFSRNAISMTSGKAVITPLKAGKAIITISHPKAAYETKILIEVTNNISIKEDLYSLSCETPFIKLKNGNTETIQVMLSGNGKTEADEANIEWICNSSSFSITPNGKNAIITATGTNDNQALLTIKHPKVKYPITVRLLSSDADATEASSFKFIYSTTTVYTLFSGENCHIYVNEYGTDANDSIMWSIVKGNDLIAFANSSKNSGEITSLHAGTAEIKATLTATGESVSFYILIKQVGIIDESLPCYLTTTQNTITVQKGETKDVFIDPINITTGEFQNIIWTNNNPEIFSLSCNGKSASISSIKEGNGTITIKHPLSKNELSINIHVGNEYVYKNTNLSYISTKTDTLLLKTDSTNIIVDAVLAYTESSLTELTGFTFTTNDKTLFEVTYNTNNNFCTITPKKAGQGILTIKHPKCENKEILVIIQKTNAELENISYISTEQNIITVIAGQYATASCLLKNSKNINTSLWQWESLNSSISDVIVNSGSSCMIRGVSPGTTKIKVSHEDCVYPLELIVICLDSDVILTNPWIKTNTNIISLKTKDSTSISAEMIGGNTGDSAAFIWSIGDPTIALINGTGNACYVKGLKAGFTSITVRNLNYPNAYQKTMYVRIEDAVKDECYITVTDKILKLKPIDTNGEIVTATLQNGEVLDAQNFVWWADDYKLVNLVSNTDKCQIVPTGISGTTTIHVKHPKVLNAIDIIVMISNYKSLSFSYDSKQIQEKTINFIPMQVPITSGSSWLEYSSDNSNICAITGSNDVCMVAGISPGYTTIRATLKSENGILDTTDMAVIVSKKEEAINTIEVNSTILNMELGKSETLEAILSGENITSLDNYNLSWTSSDESVLSILKTENGIAKGKNAYITAKKAGEAILTLSHPKCKFDVQVWVIIPEKKETTITLNQTYIEMYKDDGSASVTANIINGTAADANSIMWTAPKVGGQVIVSVSKATGKTCNIVPKSIGSTTLRAQLPNGNFADCIVTVLANAEIVLETKALYVNPGFTETVHYSVIPENAAVNWLSMFNTSTNFGGTQDTLFTYEVNEATKTISITGCAIGKGSLNGYFASSGGTANCILNVNVEYNYELTLNSPSVITTAPKDNEEFRVDFTVYPKTLDITAIAEHPNILEIKSISLDEVTGKGFVTVKPLKEGIGEKITIKATNPKDLLNTPISKTQIVNSKYDELHVTPVFNFSSGSFSRLEGNTLYLGDGESYVFYLDVAEKNATMDNLTITYKDAAGNNKDQYQSGICKQDNPQIDKNSNHIIFNGNRGNGILEVESTTAEGKNLYSFGHNYDYIESNDLYLVKGNFSLPYGKVIYWGLGGEFSGRWTGPWYNRKYDRSWLNYLEVFFNNGMSISNIERTNGNPPSVNGVRNWYKSICTRIDNNYYAFEKNIFEQNKNYFIPFLSNTIDGKDGTSHNYASRYFSFSPIAIHPYYLNNNTNTKKTDVNPSRGYGIITISYMDSNKKTITKSINVIVEVRNCEKSTNGYWKETKINGQTCWQLVNTKGLPENLGTLNSNFIIFKEKIDKIFINETKTLELNHDFLNDNFIWSVDDHSILNITSNGKKCTIKGLKEGTTTLYAKRNDSITYSSIPITVNQGFVYCDFNENTKILDKNNTFVLTIKSDDIPASNLNQTKVEFVNPSIARVEKQTIVNNNLEVTIKALKGGDTPITIFHPYTNETNDIFFNIKVPYAVLVNTIENLYITESKILELQHNLSTDNFIWSVDDPSVLNITPNGKKCTIKGLKKGTTIIHAKRNDSNLDYEIPIQIKSGSFICNELENSQIVIIENDKTFSINLTSNTLESSLFNLTNITIGDTSIVKIEEKTIYDKIKIVLKAFRGGNTNVRISHPYCEKDIVFSVTVPYFITLKENISSLNIDEIKTLELQHNYQTDDFTWSIEDPSILNVTSNGKKCTIKGLKKGTTIIHVTNIYGQLIDIPITCN